MSTPKSATDIDALSALGVTHVVTLTKEEPLPSSWFTTVRNTFLPIPDGAAPSMDEFRIFIDLVAHNGPGALLVHCGGGKGRAGSMLAAWLCAFGFSWPDENELFVSPGVKGWWRSGSFSATQAIEIVRQLRPGSIETEQQEEGIRIWAKEVGKRGPFPDYVSEPAPSRPVTHNGSPLTASALQNVDLIVLVGLPGSGKTWLRRLLCARDPNRWYSVSGDEDGGRKAVERAVSQIGSGAQLADGSLPGLIVDRCNVDQAARAEIFSLAIKAKKAVVVYFDYSSELCESRARRRPDHPSVKPGSAASVIKQFARKLVAPTLKEGFGEIITVSSREAALELATIMAPISAPLKFPRTPHFLNLGAATEDDLIIEDLERTSLFDGAGGRIRRRPSDERDEADFQQSAQTKVQWVLTEKCDGANMGISLSNHRSLLVQNRSHWISSSDHAQFKRLDHWLNSHRAVLYQILDRDNDFFPERFILYGEWMAATHSIKYDRLPSLFIAFDLYDRWKRIFLPRSQMERIMDETGIPMTPVVEMLPSLPSPAELERLANGPSLFTTIVPREGIYVKLESDMEVRARGKVVRKGFISGNTHWTDRPTEYNSLALEL